MLKKRIGYGAGCLLTFLVLLSASASAEALTFEDQCDTAGIEFEWEDPNAELYTFTSTDPSIDAVTHASGNPKYAEEPYIHTPLDLVERSSTKVLTYYWQEDEEGVSTLAEAARLPDARYVVYPFPEDGKKYSIAVNKSSVGSHTICTVDENGMPAAAVFGMKFVAEGDDAYTSVAIMSETATYRNIMAGSGIVIVYYEYNPHSEQKIGIGNRNAGARVCCEMDEELSTLTVEGSDEKITVSEYRTVDTENLQVRYLTLKAKVIELDSLG